jgi:hypothetical protein
VLACNGNPLNRVVHSNVSFDIGRIHYGAVAASYHCLEQLGLLFYHPLDTYVPDYLVYEAGTQGPDRADNGFSHRVGSSTKVYHQDVLLAEQNICGSSVRTEVDSPRWPDRGFHLHTQHPLELTEVLQGHDVPQVGLHGSHCIVSSDERTKRLARISATAVSGQIPRGGTFRDSSATMPTPVYCERWEDMIEDVNILFQWAVANRLNKIEWLLLGNYKWEEELETKQKRLKIITSLAHEYSLMVGADCPIGNIQQHAWHIVNVRMPFAEQVKQIHERVDWIFYAGFDFLTTESGLSEFTHPECGLMLDLMNVFASHINGTWGKAAAIKVHCSTKQYCEEERFLYPSSTYRNDDLETIGEAGTPVNFNFLPHFATTQMGVMPHTIQAYAFDDPTAGAYGNANFSYMEEYLVREAKAGQRTVLYYGETAYW